jgi:transcriptional regulator with PAS, ATPase and Fis domain
MGRVIAATNRPKADIMGGRVFRDDFYYRLCSDIIEVPPLRRRIREGPQELDRLSGLHHTIG